MALLGFSAVACGLHLVGWALFAAGHGGESAVIAAVLHSLGIILYLASLVWLVEGLTHAALQLSAGRSLSRAALVAWPGPASRAVALGLLNTGLALAAASLAGFVAWSLLVFLLPPLSLPAALLGLLAVVTAGLSQLFTPCLVLDQGLAPSRAFREGMALLRQHAFGMLALAPLLLGLLMLPLAIGLVAEAIAAGLGVVITALAMVMALPLLSCTVTAAYRQIQPEAPGFRAGAR